VKLKDFFVPSPDNGYSPHFLQKVAMGGMAGLVLLTFVGANLHALLWQSSEWLVSTVLPAVVVDLTNQQRASNATAPLQRNVTLDEAARLKAEHMAKHEYFSHYSPDGVSPWHWFQEVGYVYAHAGENLAIHFTDSAQVVDAWMNSPSHRQNIVNGQYLEIGVGTARGTYEGYDTVYVVQLFGAPAVAPAPQPAAPPRSPVATAPVAEPVVSEVVEEVLVDSEPVLVTEGSLLPETIVMAEEVTAPIPATETLSEVTEVTPQADILTAPVEPAPNLTMNTEELRETAVTYARDVVIIESSLIATSSGLAVAQITLSNQGHAGGTLASIATQPNALLQIVYVTLGALVLFLLLLSVAIEARRFRYVQVAYGALLIVGMGGLWFAHSLLTSGAVVA
jgi:hypothetical protein